MPRQYVQKYVIVHFIDVDNAPVHFSSSEWPLHITLLANFQVKDIESFKGHLQAYANSHAAYTVHTDGEALFGPQRTIRVSLIEPCDAIMAAHADLLSIAVKQGAILDEPSFASAGYRPHATIQAGYRLQDQQEVLIDSLSLVDMFPEQNHMQRKILRTYDLRG